MLEEVKTGFGNGSTLVRGRGGFFGTGVILVLSERIWNAPEFSLFLQAFDDTGSLGSHPRQVVYPPI